MERTPRADLYRMNPDHVLAGQIEALFEREEVVLGELVSFLRDSLTRHAPFVTTAILFGSAVQGGMEPASDIDLAVVCAPERVPDVEEALEPVEEGLRRRFGNRLSVVVGKEPAADLAKPGRTGARLWGQVLQRGLVIVPDGGSRG